MSIMETMGRKKRPRRSFSKEFKAEVVDLVRQAGNTAASVTRDLDLTETAVGSWANQADVDRRRRDGLTSDERADPNSTLIQLSASSASTPAAAHVRPRLAAPASIPARRRRSACRLRDSTATASRPASMGFTEASP
jgi:transposase